MWLSSAQTGPATDSSWGPQALAVASTGDVYVADSDNKPREQFHSDGSYVAQSAPGQFTSTYGIALSPSSGNVYVTEHLSNRVQELSLSLGFITQFGPGQLSGALDLAVSASECVYVSDYASSSIKRFGSSCPPLTQPPSLTPVASISGLSVSPSRFRAASKGASIAAHKPKKTGATVTYKDSQAASTTFTVLTAIKGFSAKGACQVKRPKGNKHAKRCTLYRPAGSFNHLDKAGSNRFHFTGRVGGHKLKPGAYRLRALPRFAGQNGVPRTARFNVKR